MIETVTLDTEFGPIQFRPVNDKDVFVDTGGKSITFRGSEYSVSFHVTRGPKGWDAMRTASGTLQYAYIRKAWREGMTFREQDNVSAGRKEQIAQALTKLVVAWIDANLDQLTEAGRLDRQMERERIQRKIDEHREEIAKLEAELAAVPQD